MRISDPEKAHLLKDEKKREEKGARDQPVSLSSCVCVVTVSGGTLPPCSRVSVRNNSFMNKINYFLKQRFNLFLCLTDSRSLY